MGNDLIVSLQGGLGNALFQIATSWWLAREHHMNWYVHTQPYSPLNQYRNNVFKKLPFVQHYPKGHELFRSNDATFLHVPKPRCKGVPLVLQFYGQNPDLWCADRLSVKNLFHFPSPKTPVSPVTMGVHYRGGDYKLYPSLHHICRRSYYESLQEIQGYRKIVVTDDREAARQEGIAHDGFNGGTNPVEDLVYLANCDALFIGNSTFAWWGAFLGDESRPIWAPSQWLGPAHPCHKEFNLCLPDWSQVPLRGK